MKTLTIINAVFSTINILWLIGKLPVPPPPDFAPPPHPPSFPSFTVIDLILGLWFLAFAIICLVYHFKKEKTA